MANKYSKGDYIQVVIAGLYYTAKVLGVTDSFVYASVVTQDRKGKNRQHVKENFLWEDVRPHPAMKF